MAPFLCLLGEKRREETKGVTYRPAELTKYVNFITFTRIQFNVI